MKKNEKTPENAIAVRTYAELEEFVEGFARGHFNLLILVGAPGLQKSRILRDTLKEKAKRIEGNATPFRMYVQLFQWRDERIVIDDVDSLYADQASVRLLKCVCNTEEVKSVMWLSNSKTLDEEGIPRSFTTRSKVAIVANQWATLNANVEAIQDRGQLVWFDPSPREIHERVGKWFRGGKDIYDFVGEHLHLFPSCSMRVYTQAQELKKAGIDWRRKILERYLDPTVALVARLKSDARFKSEEERVKAFIEAGGGSRATYFNHAKRLREGVDGDGGEDGRAIGEGNAGDLVREETRVIRFDGRSRGRLPKA
jgi:hypothetical protein